MILIDGNKYACSECVRGHRSSQCRHHMRPLLQVRSKGRPNLLPSGNKNFRIAVFALEIEDDNINNPANDAASGSCKDTPVVILRASDKHVIDINTGRIMGRYTDIQNEKALRPVIKADSFVNSTSCCSEGALNVRKSCGCNHRKVSKSKILKSYIDKKKALSRQKSQAYNQNHAGPHASNKVETMFPPSADAVSIGSKQEQVQTPPCCRTAHSHGGNTQQGDVKSERSSSGFCCSSASEDSSFVQMPNTDQTQRISTPSSPPAAHTTASYRDNTTASYRNGTTPSYHDGTTLRSMSGERPDPLEKKIEEFEVIKIPSCSAPGTCCCASDCSCPTCTDHNNAPLPPEGSLEFLNNDTQYGSNLVLMTNSEQQHPISKMGHDGPKDFSAYSAMLAQYVGDGSQASSLLNELLLDNSPERGAESIDRINGAEGSCSCADDACFCLNCERHCIINGYRLDDVFGFSNESNVELQTSQE